MYDRCHAGRQPAYLFMEDKHLSERYTGRPLVAFYFPFVFWADDGLANCFWPREGEGLFVFSWLKSLEPGFGLGRMTALELIVSKAVPAHERSVKPGESPEHLG